MTNGYRPQRHRFCGPLFPLCARMFCAAAGRICFSRRRLNAGGACSRRGGRTGRHACRRAERRKGAGRSRGAFGKGRCNAGRSLGARALVACTRSFFLFFVHFSPFFSFCRTGGALWAPPVFCYSQILFQADETKFRDLKDNPTFAA